MVVAVVVKGGGCRGSGGGWVGGCDGGGDGWWRRWL